MPRAKWWALLGLFFSLAACGTETVYRPVELNLVGLSIDAERLVIFLFPEDTGQLCVGVTLENVASLSAPLQVEWTRSADEGNKRLTLPEVDAFKVTLVAYTEDVEGTVIQQACVSFDYAQIESPYVTLQLSARPRG